MKLFLISNNLGLNDLSYSFSSSLEEIRMVRPLSIEGEKMALEISQKNILDNVVKIYSSFYSSALASAKYLSNRLNLEINMDSNLNDCKVGFLGSKNMQMVKGMQDREFTYKLPNGESLTDVGDRLNNFIKNITIDGDMAIYTHKRAILGLLIKYSKVDHNLDEDLILEYNDKLIYDNSDNPYDIYEITIMNNEIVDINLL